MPQKKNKWTSIFVVLFSKPPTNGNPKMLKSISKINEWQNLFYTLFVTASTDDSLRINVLKPIFAVYNVLFCPKSVVLVL